MTTSFDFSDLSSITLLQNYADYIGTKPLVLAIPVRKPNKQEFFRTHPDLSFWKQVLALELKQEREEYLVCNSLWSELGPDLTAKVLVPCVSRDGVPFIWSLKLPDPNGRMEQWGLSAMEAAKYAQTRWLRMQANMAAGHYVATYAANLSVEPQWPHLTINEWLQYAFKDFYVDTINHPVIKKLRGEV